MSPRRSRFARLRLERLEGREVPAAGILPTPLSAPTVPGAFALAPLSNSQVRLSWTDSAREDGYRVYKWNGETWAVAGNAAANATSFVAGNLAAGKTYHFYVEAFNAAGAAAADFLSVNTASPPTVPRGFTATAISGTQVRLSWNDSLDEQGYRLYQWNGSSWGRIGDVAANATSFTASGLAGGKTYYFYVEAYNARGAAAAHFVSVRTAPPPAAPAAFAVTALSGTQARLSWADVAGEDGYRAYQWNGATWNGIGTIGANATSFVASGLTPGKTYYFYVEAFNSAGATAASFRNVVMPVVAPTVPPTFSAVPLFPSQVHLSWADSAREDGYRVYQWNGVTWTLLATTGANATSFVVSGLGRHRTYYFYVEAFNGIASAATNFLAVTMG